MAITLIEAAKVCNDPLQRGVIETFAETSPVLEMLPFMNVSSNSYRYNQEETLPGIGWRGIGGSYTESTGVLNPVTETLSILGGTSDVDRALVKTQGTINDLRAIHTRMKSKAAAHEFTRCFFKGDSVTTPTEFDGLEKRLTGNQKIAAGSTANGSTLTLGKVDELIDAVSGGPDALFMNKTMRRKINTLVRAAGQATETVSGNFGRLLTAYAGIPILVVEDDAEGDAIFSFDESCTSGTATGTSIYAIKFGVSEYVSGLQCGEIDVIDHGLYAGGVAYRTLIEWITGIAVFHPKAAARLYSISNS